MRQEFSASFNAHPELILRTIRKGKGEAFHSEYANGKIYLDADSSHAVIFGKGLLQTVIPSGHYAEFLGPSQPRFSLRPLWLTEGDTKLIVTEQVELAVPAWVLRPESLDRACHQILSLGFNAVILGGSGKPYESSVASLRQICAAFHERGLKVIVQPRMQRLPDCHCPLHEPYREKLTQAIREAFANVGLDGVLWESESNHTTFFHAAEAKSLTSLDVWERELALLEEAVRGVAPLIYYLPVDGATVDKRTHALMRLGLKAKRETILAFSALAGDAADDHLPLHPLWEELRSSPRPVGTWLLPIVNLGGVKQGEGLWPSLPFDLYQRVFSRLRRHSFIGVAALTPQLPSAPGMLQASLWIGGQLLWRDVPPELLAQTWLRAHPQFDVAPLDIYRRLRELVIEFSGIRARLKGKKIPSEECRLIAESLVAQLQRMQCQLVEVEGSLADYYCYFHRDARRILQSFLQEHHPTLAKLLAGGDFQEAFWTQATPMQDEIRVQFLERPFVNPQNPKMAAIYSANRLLEAPLSPNLAGKS